MTQDIDAIDAPLQEPVPANVPPARSRMPLYIGLATVVAVLTVACIAIVAYAYTLKNGTFSIKGQITISDTTTGLEYGSSTAACKGAGGYTDIHEGADVVVTDATGKTVAIGHLLEGRATYNALSPTRPQSCTWQISVDDVPDGDNFYGIAIGSEQRGKKQYQRDELDIPLHLTLG